MAPTSPGPTVCWLSSQDSQHGTTIPVEVRHQIWRGIPQGAGWGWLPFRSWQQLHDAAVPSWPTCCWCQAISPIKQLFSPTNTVWTPQWEASMWPLQHPCWLQASTLQICPCVPCMLWHPQHQRPQGSSPICCQPLWAKKLPLEAPSPPSLPPLLQHLPAWEECLWSDPDREFILNGIVHGFSLIDPQVTISDIAPAYVPNNKSTCSDVIKSCIDDAVSNELISGGYIPCTEQPKIISALSAIPKPDGGVRLIHDLSRPADQSVNSYASKDYCKYESISDAIALIQPGWFMAVVDLKSAYRSVHIRPDEQCITGLQWQFSGQKQPLTMCDTRLPFGARKSPAIFNRITQAVARSLRQAGHHVVVYLDYFFECGPDFVSCKATYDALIIKLRNLGVQISWNKVVDPCQQLVFLGIQIDAMTGHLSLKPEKLSELCGLIHTFWQRKRVSPSQLESLAGKLCWASHVVPWGRTHLRSIYVLISSLKSPTHKCRLGDLQADLTWWHYWLNNGENWRHIWPQPLPLMYLPMPVPMLVEPSAAVTCFMHTGPMMFHG